MTITLSRQPPSSLPPPLPVSMISAHVISTALSHSQPTFLAAPSPLTCANFSSTSIAFQPLPHALSCLRRSAAAAVKVCSSCVLERSGVPRAGIARHRCGDAGVELCADHKRREHGFDHCSSAHFTPARYVLIGSLIPDTSLHVSPSHLSLHPSLLPQASIDPAFVESWSKYILLRHVHRTALHPSSRLVNEPIRYADVQIAETLFLHSNITSEMNFTRDLLALHLKSSSLLFSYPQPSLLPPFTSTSPTPCSRSTQPNSLLLSTYSSLPRPPTCCLPSPLSPFSSTTVSPLSIITHRAFPILSTR